MIHVILSLSYSSSFDVFMQVYISTVEVSEDKRELQPAPPILTKLVTHKAKIYYSSKILAIKILSPVTCNDEFSEPIRYLFILKLFRLFGKFCFYSASIGLLQKFLFHSCSCSVPFLFLFRSIPGFMPSQFGVLYWDLPQDCNCNYMLYSTKNCALNCL